MLIPRKKPPSTLLLVDFNNILFRGMHAHKELSHDGVCTGGLYGFIRLLCSYVAMFPPKDIVVCMDSPPYHRKDRFPGYKGKRKKDYTDEEMLAKEQSVELVDIFLRILNITIWEEDGWEADDLMAELARRKAGEYDRIVILSNDDDLYQLLDVENLVIQRHSGLFNLDKFTQKYPGLVPKDWIRYNALSGGHNDIPGLRGIGPVKALNIIRTPGLWETTLAENKEDLDLFLELVELPYPSIPVPGLPEMENAKYPEGQMMMFLQDLGINLTHTMREGFDSIGTRR
ncbi:MAG: hypothetical protein KAR06_00475 [Deltaproteobacteria bacterium]|nr:hypothetical protein [Deltaproteobacteria bacterium]